MLHILLLKFPKFFFHLSDFITLFFNDLLFKFPEFILKLFICLYK